MSFPDAWRALVEDDALWAFLLAAGIVLGGVAIILLLGWLQSYGES